MMFRGADIGTLIELLKKRGAYLYHACQLLDFRSYLNVGGIPSRACLEEMRQPFTPFETDESDRNRNVWDKVFANLSDFGLTFARGGNAVPNTYGPILFQIRPDALSEATDVAICLRSAGGQNFNREVESLSSIDDVDRLFQHPVGDHKSQYVKNRWELQQEFSEITSDISAPEISCTVDLGYLPLNYVNFVRVEPYVLQENYLATLVEQFRDASDCQFRIFQRDSVPPYTHELIEFLSQETPSLPDLCQNPDFSPELRNWATRVRDRNLEYQFNRFARYLRTGTVLPVLQEQL